MVKRGLNMKKILVDAERLVLLIKLADLSNHTVCLDGTIRDCDLNSCCDCSFHDGLHCFYDFDDYKGIIDWLCWMDMKFLSLQEQVRQDFLVVHLT